MQVRIGKRLSCAGTLRLTTGAAALWLATVAAGAARADEPAVLEVHGPRAKAETTEVDLGLIARGTAPRAKFALHNLGDAELRILEAKPG